MVVPLAIQSVPVTLAQDQGFTRILDVVRNVSGVTSKEAYFGVTDDFNICGFDASTSLYNGFRRDFYGTVNDISEVERVEVIKGPSSVTEGFLEPGGVINVVTKRPLASRVSEVFLTTEHTEPSGASMISERQSQTPFVFVQLVRPSILAASATSLVAIQSSGIVRIPAAMFSRQRLQVTTKSENYEFGPWNIKYSLARSSLFILHRRQNVNTIKEVARSFHHSNP